MQASPVLLMYQMKIAQAAVPNGYKSLDGNLSGLKFMFVFALRQIGFKCQPPQTKGIAAFPLEGHTVPD